MSAAGLFLLGLARSLRFVSAGSYPSIHAARFGAGTQGRRGFFDSFLIRARAAERWNAPRAVRPRVKTRALNGHTSIVFRSRARSKGIGRASLFLLYARVVARTYVQAPLSAPLLSPRVFLPIRSLSRSARTFEKLIARPSTCPCRIYRLSPPPPSFLSRLRRLVVPRAARLLNNKNNDNSRARARASSCDDGCIRARTRHSRKRRLAT